LYVNILLGLASGVEAKTGRREDGKRGRREEGKTGRGEDGKTGRREEVPPRMSLRGIAERSEAIPRGVFVRSVAT